MEGRIPHVWLYGRVSSAGQVTEGSSIEAQEAKLLAWTKFRFPDSVDSVTGKPVLVTWPPAIDAAVSASKRFIDRPGGKRLWGLFQPGDHLAVVRFDRLFRSVADFDWVVNKLLERGVNLHILDVQVDASTPIGKMVLTILASVAQFEREVISERTRATLEWKRANNLPVSGSNTPFGYKKVGVKKESRFEVDLEERNLCRFILDLYDNQGLSQRQIAMQCWTDGLQLRGKTTWSPHTIEKILKATRANFPLTTGYLDDSGLFHPHPSTVSPSTATDSGD